MSEVADGPETSTSGRPVATVLEAADELGHGLDDLALPHDADVQVGQQRQRPPTLARPAVEGERARRGARQRAGRQGAVQPVELPRVSDESSMSSTPVRSQPRVEVGGIPIRRAPWAASASAAAARRPRRATVAR